MQEVYIFPIDDDFEILIYEEFPRIAPRCIYLQNKIWYQTQLPQPEKHLLLTIAQDFFNSASVPKRWKPVTSMKNKQLDVLAYQYNNYKRIKEPTDT